MHLNNCTFIYRPNEGMICLSRTDKNPFNVESKIKVTRLNFKKLLYNITNDKLHCHGEGESYNLDDICIFDTGDGDPDSARKPCTMMDKETKIELNP